MDLPVLTLEPEPDMPVAMIAATMPSIRPVALDLSALRLLAGSVVITALPAHQVMTGLPSWRRVSTLGVSAASLLNAYSSAVVLASGLFSPSSRRSNSSTAGPMDW